LGDYIIERLLLITDRLVIQGSDLLAALDASFSAGLRLLQFREKDLPNQERFLLGKEVKKLADSYGVKLIVNGDPSLALALNAVGVHLGRSTLPIQVVKNKLKFEGIIGYSAHTVDEAKEAFKFGADYVTLSPVFQPVSKTKSVQNLGLEIFRDEIDKVSGHVYALGGISSINAHDCIDAGAYGVAVVGSILGSDDPFHSTKEILKTVSD